MAVRYLPQAEMIPRRPSNRSTRESSFLADRPSETSSGHSTLPATPSSENESPCFKCRTATPWAARSLQNLPVCRALNIASHPQFADFKIFKDGRKPAQMILMRVRERHDVDFFDSARPQIWRDHVFAHIDSGAHSARMKTPQSRRRHRPASCDRAETKRKMLSPWPTSSTVTSSRCGARRGAKGYVAITPAVASNAATTLPSRQASSAANRGGQNNRQRHEDSHHRNRRARNAVARCMPARTSAPRVQGRKRRAPAALRATRRAPELRSDAASVRNPSGHGQAGQQQRRHIGKRPGQRHAMKIVGQRRQHAELQYRRNKNNFPEIERGAQRLNHEGSFRTAPPTRQARGNPRDRRAHIQPKLNRRAAGAKHRASRRQDARARGGTVRSIARCPERQSRRSSRSAENESRKLASVISDGRAARITSAEIAATLSRSMRR